MPKFIPYEVLRTPSATHCRECKCKLTKKMVDAVEVFAIFAEVKPKVIDICPKCLQKERKS